MEKSIAQLSVSLAFVLLLLVAALMVKNVMIDQLLTAMAVIFGACVLGKIRSESKSGKLNEE